MDRVVSVVLALSALSIASAYVYRSVGGAGGGRPRTNAPPSYIREWRQGISVGHVEAGPESARVTIVELADLECPACRGFQRTLDAALDAWPHDVRAVYGPQPLAYHRFALSAARAAECAAREHLLHDWIDAVYNKQDSLGLKSWGS